MTETLTLTRRLYKVTKIPNFRTQIINYGNKVEQRLALDSVERYRFQLQFLEHLSDAVMDEIMAFFIARKGSFEAFYLVDTYETFRPVVWSAGKLYAAGAVIRPTTINNHAYKCSISGTSGVAEPTWPTTVNGTVVDGGATWRENTYLVRFEADLVNAEYVHYQMATYGTINFIEVDE